MHRAILASLIVAAGCFAWAAESQPTSAPSEEPKLSPEAMEAWGSAPTVLVATLKGAIAGPVGLSNPPMRTYRMTLDPQRVLRGDKNLKGKELQAGYVVRGPEPALPIGDACLVSLRLARERWTVLRIEPAGEGRIAQAELACKVPAGWSMKDGKLRSPWASMGEKAWPADAKSDDALACARTGRPALPAGDVEFSVEKVPPAEEIRWTNPDGDGEYKITVRNATDKPVDVPALRQSGDDILWNESLVILCQNKAYPAPRSKGIAGQTKPVTLQPGQSVSTTVNALMLDGPEWPRGGYRIEFTFCLGEKAQTMSFYYMSRHHDALRATAREKCKAETEGQ